MDKEKGLDYSADIVYFPVRHHSPACSVHLKSVISDYKPDCLLIEGPENGNFLMKYLGGDEIKPPVCIYCGYDDKDGAVGVEKEKYRAYYPFLDFSPELMAIRAAAQRGIPAFFIDMPYPMQLVHFGGKEYTRLFGGDSTEDYYSRVAEKSGCRSFSEFWERSFEVNGLALSDGEFVDAVKSLGEYMRELSPADEKNRYRECFMRQKISGYRQKYRKLLVVAGAYHIKGLAGGTEELKFNKYRESSASMYIVPYSFAESDSRSGYGAGIPFPAFYSAVWKKLRSGAPEPYAETVRDFIIGASRYARSKQQQISLTDEIQAQYMATELAALRGKLQPGAFELTDGVRAAFVKGDINTSASFELDYLFRMMTGLGAGEVNISDENADITPPCVVDFRAQCRKFRISLRTVAGQHTVLDIVKNANHYEKSCFLHRMAFLETNFCRRESGPDYVNGRDTSLVREQWVIRYSAAAEAKLTDLSVYGGSVAEICMNILARRFSSAQSAADAGQFLLETYTMGFAEKAAEFLPDAENIIRSDTDFVSQCGFMVDLNRILAMLKVRAEQYSSGLTGLLRISFAAALNQLENVRGADGDSADEICGGIRLMNSLTADYPEQCSRAEFLAEAEKITESSGVSAQIYGVCLAICAKSGIISEDGCCDTISCYMATSEGEPAAAFLSGIISVGRDLIFTGERVLASIDSSVSRMDRESFISALPHFRRAFTAFLPQETLRISRRIAGIYGAEEECLTGSAAYSADEILYACVCDEKARRLMEKWGMLDGGDENG